MRFGATFIILCIAVIGASLGAVAYLVAGFSLVEALATALTSMSLLAAYHMFAGRAQERAEAMRQVSELSRGTADLAHQVKELGRRVVAAEAEAARAREEARDAVQPLSGEIEVLGQLVGQLAQSVAAHEAALIFAPAPPPAAAAAPVLVATPAASLAPPVPLAPLVEDDGLLAGEAEDDLAAVRAAIEENRIDLYLQPIVTLPQRKVKHYEAVARLRTDDGAVLAPADFAAAAERAGLGAMLDNLMVLRAVQVARRLSAKNKDAVLCCAIAGTTLADAALFPELFDFLLRHRALASAVVLALPQEAVRTLAGAEQEALARLAELGYRFALDRVTGLELEPRRLAQQGFRFVKAPAALLLDREAALGGAIAAADFANLLERYGIDLIAEGVETEGTVVDLLDYDLKLAQGTLFSAPRPVRPEVFRTEEPPRAETPAASPAKPRRREGEPAVAARPAPEQRTPQGLVKLARTIMRRA